MKSTVFLSIFLFLSINVFSQQSTSRVYNGYNLTEQDVVNIFNAVGEWITSYANYSTNIRDWSILCEKVKELMILGQIPIFSTTGTGISIGDVYISPGKTDQNLAGFWTEDNLKRQFASKLKEALDQYTTPIGTNTSISTPSQTTNEKFHYGVSGIISEKYFAGIWENTKKGIKYWNAETKRDRTRQAIIYSINNYKSRYGENSPYISKLSELNNPNISVNLLIEIAFSMGEDVTWIFYE